MLRYRGFEPFYDQNSRVLILGSFPSVKSRQQGFYYGNKQNRFWKTLSEFFGGELPETIEEKKNFLAQNRIALWDVVTECEIVGSEDSSIKNYSVADIKKLLQNSQIGFIILNGGKAAEIYLKRCLQEGVPYIKLPSTSPANTSFAKEKWFDALSTVFGRT